VTEEGIKREKKVERKEGGGKREIESKKNRRKRK
jgi:hypothetical protein